MDTATGLTGRHLIAFFYSHFSRNWKEHPPRSFVKCLHCFTDDNNIYVMQHNEADIERKHKYLHPPANPHTLFSKLVFPATNGNLFAARRCIWQWVELRMRRPCEARSWLAADESRVKQRWLELQNFLRIGTPIPVQIMQCMTAN